MSAARRLFVATLSVLVGGLVFSGASALAAGPEAPVTGEANPVTTTTATLNGEVGELNPENALEVGTYEFLYRESATTCEGGETAPVPAGVALSKEAESQPLSGLSPGTTYTFCLLARNSAGETALGAPVTFTSDGAGITEEQVMGVEATAATLQADINPGGSSASYHFEYDTTPYTSSAAHGTSLPMPSKEIESGTSPVPVSARLTELQPGTTYYYRVVAVDEIETFDGPGKTLTTPIAPGSAPTQSCPNEQLRAEQPYGLELPDCRAYEMVSPVEKNGNDATDPQSELGISQVAVSGEAIEYQSHGSFASPGGSVIHNDYISRRGPGGWSTQSIMPPLLTTETEPSEAYFQVFTRELSKGIVSTDVPLTSEAPEGFREAYLETFASGPSQWVSRDIVNGAEPYVASGGSFVVEGFSPDLSHIVFYGAGIPEWIEGKSGPTLVGVTNSGEVIGGALGSGSSVVDYQSHAVSSDGSRVFFTSSGTLYVRENPEREQSPVEAGRCTVPADACTVEIAGGAPQYQSANADGSKVFFTRGEDLYQYDVDTAQTTAITKGGKVQSVEEVSEDGSYVYFVAEGDLAGAARLGAPNLYVSHEGGAPVFIATLAEGGGVDAQDLSEVTPDGTRLAFLSRRSLTGYDNAKSGGGSCGLNAKTGQAEPVCPEIFVYDAVTGQLACASCNPGGARPVGPSSFNSEGLKSDNFSEAGVLFFESSDALVPHASDGLRNVYEYEDGHIYPISDVAGGRESFLMGTSASGSNVFFGTAAQLLPQDRDDRVDVYDARVDGGYPVSSSPPSCNNGDSCKLPPAPQPAVFGEPSSETFSGRGNTGGAGSSPIAMVTPKQKTAAQVRADKLAKTLKICSKEKKPKRARCERQARSKYGATMKAKKSSNGRGSK